MFSFFYCFGVNLIMSDFVWFEQSKKIIDNFSLEDRFFYLHDSTAQNIIGKGSVYYKTDIPRDCHINFNNSSDSKVFIGEGVAGNFSISIRGDNSTVYIGNYCRLSGLRINSNQTNDFVAIGNHVTTTARNTWISGKGAGNARPFIIIGDDCMFAYDIVIRNTDEHPIISSVDDSQINSPKLGVVIEPHVWVCEQVNILKDLCIGANSIISLGTTVTKNIPRYSVAKGIPAQHRQCIEQFWIRQNNDWAIKKAKYYYEKYKI